MPSRPFNTSLHEKPLNSHLQMDVHAGAEGVTEALVLPLACPAVDHHALLAKLDACVWCHALLDGVVDLSEAGSLLAAVLLRRVLVALCRHLLQLVTQLLHSTVLKVLRKRHTK